MLKIHVRREQALVQRLVRVGEVLGQGQRLFRLLRRDHVIQVLRDLTHFLQLLLAVVLRVVEVHRCMVKITIARRGDHGVLALTALILLQDNRFIPLRGSRGSCTAM